MPILGMQTATRWVYPEPTRDDTGATVRGTPVESTFRGSFQPLNGHERQALDEGVRSKVTLKVYTRSVLQTANEETGRPADEVDYNGSRWTVYQVYPWPKLIPHHKALLMRKQRSDPGAL